MPQNHEVQQYMKLPYKIEMIRDEEGGYTFSHPELPGCATCAMNIEEGLALLEDARRCWIEAALEQGMGIPLPNQTEGYSGQFKLRIPKTLHRELALASQNEGVSMNQYCVYLLSRNLANFTPQNK